MTPRAWPVRDGVRVKPEAAVESAPPPPDVVPVEPQPLTVNSGAPDLAFTMQLKAIPPEHPTIRAPGVTTPLPAPPARPADPPPAPLPAPQKTSKPRAASNRPEPAAADPKPATAARPAAQTAPQTVAEPVRSEETPHPETPQAVEVREVVAPEPPEPTRPTPTAHDIKLQLTGGPQRVEVRLTERAGQVQVAVRTPDSHLAGTLRENLPALSQRLVETGFRAEAWHPGAAASEIHRTLETSQGNLSQDNDQQPGGQRDGRQPGDDPRRPKPPAEPIDPKQKGRHFSWFISSPQ
jgi:hypothetical protein